MSIFIHDGSRGYINQYAEVESQYDQGSFDFAINSGQGELRFFPTKFKMNDYNVTTFSYNLDDVFAGVGTTSLGGYSLLNQLVHPLLLVLQQILFLSQILIQVQSISSN